MTATVPLRELRGALDVLLDADARADEVGWRRAVSERVAELLHADHAYVQIAGAPRLYVGTGIDESVYAALERELAEASAGVVRYEDPEMERLHRLGRRGARIFTRVSVSEAMGVHVEDTRIYREVCVPAGMDDFVGMTSRTRQGEVMLWASRKGVRPGFAVRNVPILETVQSAFEAALQGLDAAASPWPTTDELRVQYGLTAREAQVALLLAEGASEKGVARALGISLHTARRHTEKVFMKLEVRARAQVAGVLLGPH